MQKNKLIQAYQVSLRAHEASLRDCCSQLEVSDSEAARHTCSRRLVSRSHVAAGSQLTIRCVLIQVATVSARVERDCYFSR